MKIISWNCQGLGNPLTFQELRALVALERPDLVFLMETKNKEVMVENVVKRLKYANKLVINPEGRAGGLVLMWNDEVEIQVLSCNTNLIDVDCYDLNRGRRMHITFIYAPTNYGERLSTWQQLREIQVQNTLPWVCLGDFNEILYAWEKAGKRAANYYRMAAFRDLLNDCYLMDIESKGCAYTWANNREGEEMVKK